jgi:hypothetical protein
MLPANNFKTKADGNYESRKIHLEGGNRKSWKKPGRKKL